MEFHVHSTSAYTRFSPAAPAVHENSATPVVIHIPGFNGDGFSDAPFALRVARLGWHCYLLEPPWSATPDLQSPSPTILFDLFERLEPTLNRLLDTLPAEAWRAITGLSMGGMFVSRELVREGAPGFDAAAMVLSSGDWSFLPRTAVEAIPDLRAAVDAHALEQIEAHMRAISPVSHADRFPPLPLFILNVEGDPRVPAANVRAFCERLSAAYDDAGVPERLESHLLPGNRHEFRRHMQRMVCDWLHAQYLTFAALP